jgi:hypothetical protein
VIPDRHNNPKTYNLKPVIPDRHNNPKTYNLEPVIPDRHNNPRTYNLKPQVVKLLSSSCCTDTNKYIKLLPNTSSIILTNHRVLKFGAV